MCTFHIILHSGTSNLQHEQWKHAPRVHTGVRCTFAFDAVILESVICTIFSSRPRGRATAAVQLAIFYMYATLTVIVSSPLFAMHSCSLSSPSIFILFSCAFYSVSCSLLLSFFPSLPFCILILNSALRVTNV